MSADWRQPDDGRLPQGTDPTGALGWPIWVKLVIVLILLLTLGWVLLLFAQDCGTKESGQPPHVEEPLDGLFKELPQYLGSIPGVQRPLGVAVSSAGKIYITESGGERKIRVFDSSGREILAFAPPDTEVPSRVPVYVASSPEGEIYVSDRAANTIYIFSEEGTLLGRVGSPLPDGQQWHPLGLTFDRAGNLYVTDVTPEKHRVLVLDPAGNLKLSFGKQGTAEGEFWFPNGLAIDSHSRIYVSDSNNGRVQVFDKDGRFLFQIGRGLGRGDLSLPRGIAIDDKDRLFVVDTSRQAVQVYDITEVPTFRGSFGADGTAESNFAFPNGLALDGDGRIYVTDRENHRVQIWTY